MQQGPSSGEHTAFCTVIPVRTPPPPGPRPPGPRFAVAIHSSARQRQLSMRTLECSAGHPGAAARWQEQPSLCAESAAGL